MRLAGRIRLGVKVFYVLFLQNGSILWCSFDGTTRKDGTLVPVKKKEPVRMISPESCSKFQAKQVDLAASGVGGVEGNQISFGTPSRMCIAAPVGAEFRRLRIPAQG